MLQQKEYTVKYVVKHDGIQETRTLVVYAYNAKEAKAETVKREKAMTGRHAFHPEIAKIKAL